MMLLFGEEDIMSLILGMDTWVFAAWILTILAAISCVLYGVYYEFLKKLRTEKKEQSDEAEAK
jgi:hypothetical protein